MSANKFAKILQTLDQAFDSLVEGKIFAEDNGVVNTFKTIKDNFKEGFNTKKKSEEAKKKKEAAAAKKKAPAKKRVRTRKPKTVSAGPQPQPVTVKLRKAGEQKIDQVAH